jgi:hypothetical protein
MKSLQQIVVLFFALCAFALAQESIAYDATVYVTSTVYRVNTVTLSAKPTGAVYNSTSTISATGASAPVVPSYYPSSNGTSAVYPTGTIAPSASAPAFTGAASHLNVNAIVAVLAAGVGYLAL